MKFYKVLGEDMESTNGGQCNWTLGEWTDPIEGELIPCETGYHLCRKRDLVQYLGPRIFLAEVKGRIVRGRGKVVARQVRLVSEFTTWNETTARLFAADAAERSLKFWLKVYPDDDRPAKAIEAARQFARGEIGAAARAAARAATWAAAWAAAGAAARAAAWDAAGAAPGAAARAAERKWQTNRLFQYLHGEIS